MYVYISGMTACSKLLIPILGWSEQALPFEHLEEGMSQ